MRRDRPPGPGRGVRLCGPVERPCSQCDLCLSAAVWLDTSEEWVAGYSRAARVAYFAELERVAAGSTPGSPLSGPRRVVPATAELPARLRSQVTERLSSPDLGRWLAQVQQVGHCAHPIRMVGSCETNAATGEVLRSYTTASEPDGIAYSRCGNRRRRVCESCSYQYQGDVFHVIMAGATGGMKGVPDDVVTHPLVFATLTAPSFGLVHAAKKPGQRGTRRCRPRSGTDASCVRTDGRCGAWPRTSMMTRWSGSRCVRTATTMWGIWSGSGGHQNCGAGSRSPSGGSSPVTLACRRRPAGSWCGSSSRRSRSSSGAA